MYKKTALITGASRGIGAAIAAKLAASGYNVAINYFNSKDLAENLSAQINSQGGNAFPLYGDVRNYEDCENLIAQTIKHFGKLDLLVANAGIGGESLIQQISLEDYHNIIATNLNGSFYIAKAAAAQMINAKSGNIIFISSILGQVGGSCEAAYAATKAAQVGLAKSLAKELGPSGIRVNAIAPGYIKTDMTKDLSDDIIADVISSTTLNRAGLAEDVAGAALFLAGDDAGFITGEVLQVSGGLLI